MTKKEEEVTEPVVEETPEPPEPQLEVTWINELKSLLTDIRTEIAQLAARGKLDKPEQPKHAPNGQPIPQTPSSLETKLDQVLALLQPKETGSSPDSRPPFLTRRKR